MKEITPRANFYTLRESLAEEGADLLMSTLRAMAAKTVRQAPDWIGTHIYIYQGHSHVTKFG